MRYGRKVAKCPGCLPDVAGAYFDKDIGRDGDWVWKCCNCGYEKRMNKSPVRKPGRSAAQVKAIEDIKAEIVRYHSLGDPEKYEFKQFEAKDQDWGGMISLVTDYGRIGDEGTLASILCRDHRHFFIGPNGGITLLNAKDGKKRRGLFDSIHCVAR